MRDPLVQLIKPSLVQEAVEGRERIAQLEQENADLRLALDDCEVTTRHACADYLNRNYGDEEAEAVEALRTLAWGPLRAARKA